MGKVYASSDWHGCGYIADMIMDYLQPDDKLYFLGDAIDRGPEGIRIMKMLLNDDRVTYLKGNHEHFMRIYAPSLLTCSQENYNEYRQNAQDWLWFNGGEITWGTMECENLDEMLSLVAKIIHMPEEIEYISPAGHKIILEHAGHTPTNFYSRHHDPLWDRRHFHDKWQTEGVFEEYKNIYLVHGHTPVQYLRFEYGYNGAPELTKEEIQLKHAWNYDEDMGDYKPTIIRYCDGHKFDIDMCTIASGRGALLDLDTFEEIYFDGDVHYYDKNLQD